MNTATVNVTEIKVGDRITGRYASDAVVKVVEVQYEENKPYAPYVRIKGNIEDFSKVTNERAKAMWEKDGCFYVECSPEVVFEKLVQA